MPASLGSQLNDQVLRYLALIMMPKVRTVFSVVFASRVVLVSLPRCSIAIVAMGLYTVVGFGLGAPCSIIQKLHLKTSEVREALHKPTWSKPHDNATQKPQQLD